MVSRHLARYSVNRMSIIFAGEEWIRDMVRNRPTIFLAGPSKLPGSNFVSYRNEFAEMARKRIPNCLIFYPEFDKLHSGGSDTKTMKILQEWKMKAIDSSSIIVVGLSSHNNGCGAGSKTELGFLLETRKNLVVYSPEGNGGSEYKENLARLKGAQVCRTLHDVMLTVCEMANHLPFVCSGRLNSTEVFANDCDPVVLRDSLAEEEKFNKNGAIWCYIQLKDHLNFKLLVNRLRHKLHHTTPTVMAFYKWNDHTRPDTVAPYATANVQTCAIILNEDETKTLLFQVETGGKKFWKYPSGSVGGGELAIEYLLQKFFPGRIVEPKSLPIKLVAGHHQRNASYDKISECCYTFVVNVSDSLEIKLDRIEFLCTTWVGIHDLVSGKVAEVDGIVVNPKDITALQRYTANGKYLPCTVDGTKMIF